MTNNEDAVPGKVGTPLLPSWMEQFCYFVRLGINTRQIGTFVQIAIDAGQRKIVQLVRAAVFPGKDMFDMQYSQR